uniref:Uncharacterized protein n=1 Tax=Oryza meridionalis TaxID=40149 RepID=A0A0E0DXX7_9ORYZ
MAAERIVGDGAIETWRAADEVTRAKYRLLAGEQRAREIEGKLGETIHQGNQISTPEVHKVMDALKSSCANLHSVVEDPLPAAKAAADEVLAARMDKAVNLNAGEVSNQPTACDIAGPSAPADNLDAPRKGTAASLMDWNPTARTFQWEDSPDPDGSRSPIHRPQLPSPRRTTFSPLQPADNKAKRRKARKWCALEEETLRKGVEQYGNGNWKDILTNNPDVFIGRKAMDLKDKWRNMMSENLYPAFAVYIIPTVVINHQCLLVHFATTRMLNLVLPFLFLVYDLDCFDLSKLECSEFPPELQPSIYMPLALNINPKKYLQVALFFACQNMSDEASLSSSEQKECKLYNEHVDDLQQLAGDYDSVIICLGARANSLPELTNKIPLRTCRGVIAEFQLPSDTIETYGSQSPSILSDAWLAFQGPRTVSIGSTWQWKSENYSSSVSDDEALNAMEELLPKASAVYPGITKWKFVQARAGIRAMPPLTANGSLPLLGCLNDVISKRSNCSFWLVGGLGARGLLFHGLAGKLTAKAVISCDENLIPPEFTCWKEP